MRDVCVSSGGGTFHTGRNWPAAAALPLSSVKERLLPVINLRCRSELWLSGKSLSHNPHLFYRMARDQRDYYYRLAKEEGFRARSAYKLLQINEKYHVIKKGDSVVDLGAAPGGWLQVAEKLSGGKIVGVDLEGITPIPGVVTFRADITAESTVDLVKEAIGGEADVVICDAAPNLSGAWDRDHAISVDLARSALKMAKKLLKPRGNFVVKVFQGDMFIDYLNEVRKEFCHRPCSLACGLQKGERRDLCRGQKAPYGPGAQRR